MKTTYVAGMCLTRTREGRVEAALVRHPYTKETDQGRVLRRLAGEWVFPSTEIQSGERPLDAAYRALRQKAGVDLTEEHVIALPPRTYFAPDREVIMHYHQIRLDKPVSSTKLEWKELGTWVNTIKSKEFRKEQERAVAQHGLDTLAPDEYVRNQPTLTIEALKALGAPSNTLFPR